MNETHFVSGSYFNTLEVGAYVQSWVVLNWCMTLDVKTRESPFKMGIPVMRLLSVLGMSIIFHKEFTATLALDDSEFLPYSSS